MVSNTNYLLAWLCAIGLVIYAVFDVIRSIRTEEKGGCLLIYVSMLVCAGLTVLFGLIIPTTPHVFCIVSGC